MQDKGIPWRVGWVSTGNKQFTLSLNCSVANMVADGLSPFLLRIRTVCLCSNPKYS